MRAEKEVTREALRLFPKLVRDAGYFAALQADPATGAVKCMGMFTRRNAYRRPVARIEEDLIECFRAREWIEESGGKWGLSDTGAAWLARRQAGAEPYREQHEMRVTEMRKGEDGRMRPVLVNQGESPIGWLRGRTGRSGRALIGAEQFDAAERLRADFTRAQLAPRVTSAWDGGVSSRRSRRAAPDGPENVSEAAIAAKQRFLKAMRAVGPELAGVLVDVCCLLRGLEDTEKTHGWPRRSGKVILQLGLTALARHYGMLKRAESPAARMRHWGSDGYRPSIERWKSGA